MPSFNIIPFDIFYSFTLNTNIRHFICTIYIDNNKTQAITPEIINHFLLDIFSFRIKYEPITVTIIELECIGCDNDTCPSIKQNL